MAWISACPPAARQVANWLMPSRIFTGEGSPVDHRQVAPPLPCRVDRQVVPRVRVPHDARSRIGGEDTFQSAIPPGGALGPPPPARGGRGAKAPAPPPGGRHPPRPPGPGGERGGQRAAGGR